MYTNFWNVIWRIFPVYKNNLVQKGLTLSQVYDFSSILFNVFHLQPTTILETQDLWALSLHIPQLYPVEVTPKFK